MGCGGVSSVLLALNQPIVVAHIHTLPPAALPCMYSRVCMHARLVARPPRDHPGRWAAPGRRRSAPATRGACACRSARAAVRSESGVRIQRRHGQAPDRAARTADSESHAAIALRSAVARSVSVLGAAAGAPLGALPLGGGAGDVGIAVALASAPVCASTASHRRASGTM